MNGRRRAKEEEPIDIFIMVLSCAESILHSQEETNRAAEAADLPLLHIRKHTDLPCRLHNLSHYSSSDSDLFILKLSNLGTLMRETVHYSFSMRFLKEW